MAVKFMLLLCVLSVTSSTVRRQPQPAHTCDTICDDDLPHMASLCGSDGVEYPSGCDFSNAQCKAYFNGTHLSMVSYGSCVTVNTPCDQVLQATCSHVTINPAVTLGSNNMHQVCGSDGHTYVSECIFMQTVCHHKQAGSSALTLNHMGPCGGQVTNGSRTVDCSPYVVDLSGLALETSSSLVTVDAALCKTDERHYVCSAGRTYTNICSFCEHEARLHKITPQHLTATITQDGICSHIGGGGAVGK